MTAPSTTTPLGSERGRGRGRDAAAGGVWDFVCEIALTACVEYSHRSGALVWVFDRALSAAMEVSV
jgi:hypothetical protein